MFYHVIRRPLHSNTTDSSNQPRNNQPNGPVPTSQLMPRYHYSRTIPNSPTNIFDSFLPGNNFEGHTIKPTIMATTTSNNNNNNSYGSFKSTFIPLVTNNQTTASNMSEFIQIPITREDGTSMTTNNYSRAVPITYISEASASASTANNNENANLKPSFTNLRRPSSRYFHHHFDNVIEEPTITTTSNISRLPSITRRLSLSIPVMTATTTRNTDDNTTNQTIPISPMRQIPIRFPQTATVTSTPANISRVSSAILRSSPISHAVQRRKTDIGHASSSPSLVTINNSPQSSSSDITMTSSNILPIRRAEAMAREAIQNLAQQQQQNSSTSENNNRSPTLSRRVIINLKNNQSVSLDSHISSAVKLPPIPSSSSRTAQRNNIYHIPVLRELQMPPLPVSILSEPSFQVVSTSNNNNNNGSYKNEFHMEIPVTITTSNDQENQIQQNYIKEDGFISRERIRSTNNNSNQTLKSILKRSSSRETVSRKNVSFMNA